jgi:hypothetical protein
MKPVRIVIFAKAALPGFAKTRLIPALGAQGAAELAQRMLAHALGRALAARVGPVELCVTPSPRESIWQSYPLPAAVQLTDQGEGDLGERMARAAQRVINGGESVLLVGTDCPTLDAVRLRQAAASLQTTDATLATAFDGGYVLLGLNRFHATLFSNMEWSTNQVGMETLRRMKNLNWTVSQQPSLHDIDEAADLQWLPAEWATDTMP